VRERLAAARLYLCTDAREREGDLAEFIEEVLAGGVDIVQLRQKGIEARQEIAALEIMADACRRHDGLLAVNDRADVAYAVRPDVLHLGQDDLAVPLARAIVGDVPAVGRSTHDERQADAGAVEAGVDYFCVGPVWPTPTKPGRPAPGPGLIRRVAASGTPRPWFAIGGIDETTVDEVLAAGARRIVVVRVLTEADDPGAAARELAGRLSRAAEGDTAG
jgi:thiamine-phosphate pyrophosphorylase